MHIAQSFRRSAKLDARIHAQSLGSRQDWCSHRCIDFAKIDVLIDVQPPKTAAQIDVTFFGMPTRIAALIYAHSTVL